MRFTFTKDERLSSQKLIDALMQRGNPSLLNFPFVCVWLEVNLPENIKAQVLISVSKKKFKRAVDRNHIKRLIREAYRLNKHMLYEQLTGKQIVLHINYIASEILPFANVQESIIKSILKINKEINKA